MLQMRSNCKRLTISVRLLSSIISICSTHATFHANSSHVFFRTVWLPQMRYLRFEKFRLIQTRSLAWFLAFVKALKVFRLKVKMLWLAPHLRIKNTSLVMALLWVVLLYFSGKLSVSKLSPSSKTTWKMRSINSFSSFWLPLGSKLPSADQSRSCLLQLS